MTTMTCLRTTGLIGCAMMSSHPVRAFAGGRFARRAAAERMVVYWAVGSCLLVFLALILALVISGKLRSLTTVVDRQTEAIESLSARVRDLETRPSPASQATTTERASPNAP
jgi:hypothetical protein